MAYTELNINSLITSKARRTILFFLLQHINEEYSIRELSRQTGLNINSTVKEVRNLLKNQILIYRPQGISKIVRINVRHPLFEDIRSCFLKAYGIGKVTYDKFKNIDNVLYILLTDFYINQTPKTAYDFDILFITKQKQGIELIANTMQDIESQFSKSIVFTVLDEADFIHRKKVLDPFVWKVLSKPFVVIKGTITDIIKMPIAVK